MNKLNTNKIDACLGRCHDLWRAVDVVKGGLILLAIAIMLISGCATRTVHGQASLDTGARWAQLPIVNYSSTPYAGDRAGAILTTLLAANGLNRITVAPSGDPEGLSALDPRAEFQRALEWAQAHGYRYGITGSVTEWQYKTGLDGEPAVGVSLRIIEIDSGAVVWSGSASRAGGWGYSTLSGAARKVLTSLVGGMPLPDDA